MKQSHTSLIYRIICFYLRRFVQQKRGQNDLFGAENEPIILVCYVSIRCSYLLFLRLRFCCGSFAPQYISILNIKIRIIFDISNVYLLEIISRSLTNSFSEYIWIACYPKECTWYFAYKMPLIS